MFDSPELSGPRWRARLNEEQRAVADHEGGPLRVLAGAGTGKTTALSARVATLIGRGVRPDRVLLLTFTRRAAAEMVNRANVLVAAGQSGQNAAHPGTRGRVRGGTFHSVAHRTLRQCADQIGLPPGFSVIDPADAADLIDLIRNETVGSSTGLRRFPRKATLADLYSRSVNTGLTLTDVARKSAPWCLDSIESVAAICREYLARKRRLALLDFDDLLLMWRQALKSESVGPSLAAAFDHVLVDEYQDVNRLQVEILQELRRTDRRLTVVGDDAQAIYSFRAADPKHILDFAADFPDASTLSLSINYRSTEPIIAAANALAADAPSGFTTTLRAGIDSRRDAPRPVISRCRDEQDQSEAVCAEVLAFREQGIPLQQQAVLVRAAHHTAHLELELGRRSIPYVKYGGLRYLEAAHVKDLLSAFRIADNPRDEVAWFRLLQLLDGVGPATARRATEALGVSAPGEDAEVMLRWPLAADAIPPPARPLANQLAASLLREPGETAVDQAARIRRAITPLIEAAYEDADARLVDLDALVDAAAHAARLSDVAADNALDPPRSTGDLAGPPLLDEDWLVLSTVHSAKGLEWDVVHMMHAADGNFPSDMALTTDAGLEEERRLFYVAATRPRRQLHVYVPLRYHHHPGARDDRHSWAQPSRFLSDRVRTHFDERTRLADLTPATSATGHTDVTSAVNDALAQLWQ